MDEEEQQSGGSVWDSVSSAASDTWGSVTGAVSEAASETWGAVSGAASDTWGAVSGAASDTWGAMTDTWGTVSGAFGGGQQDEGPISVPVTPEQEAAARAQVEESERLNNDPNYRNPYQQKQDQEAANVAAWEKKNAEKNAALEAPQKAWDAELDKYLAGKGPNPGSRDEYINKYKRRQEDASPNGPYSGQY